MSGQLDVLLVDIGNSRVKYALCEPAQSRLKVVDVDAIEDLFAPLQLCSNVIVACVGNAMKLDELQQLCNASGRSMRNIETQAQSFGIHCAYNSYQTLGVDRWLAVLAARAMTDLPVAVIDIGTAATCDFVFENSHLGGWISPGFALMHDALLSNTQKVFGNPGSPERLIIGDSTEECVNMGCMAAVQGLLHSAERHLQNLADDYLIIVSGGAKNLLKELQDERILFEDNMVLKGLSRYL